MGQLCSKEAEGKFVKYGVRIYDLDDLEALNLYLSKRDALAASNKIEFVSTIVTQDGIYTQLHRLSEKFLILQDDKGISWMVIQKGAEYRKLFCLESWKRFEFGTGGYNLRKKQFHIDYSIYGKKREEKNHEED